MSREYKGVSRLGRRKKPLLVLFIIIVPILLPNATAHELMDFSMMLKDDGPVPANIGAGIIFEGDGVFSAMSPIILQQSPWPLTIMMMENMIFNQII